MNGPSDQFSFYTKPETVRTKGDIQGQDVLPMNHCWNKKVRVDHITQK